MADLTVLAVDIGAESGRVMAMHFDGVTLVAEEIHRFPNIPVQVGTVLYWDALRLFSEIQTGIQKGKSLNPASLGIDTWGVDFGLLDMDGQLLGNPVHYRDQRTKGMMDFVFERIPREDIFSQTGIQFMQINTLYQLASLVHNNSAQLTSAHTFLTIPDVFNYWLTGVKACEFTNATTTQLFNPTTGDWAWDILQEVGIPERIFPQVIQPGTLLGEYEGISVIAPACHDTGSAVAAIPTRTTNSAYISSGTWSLVGLEVEHPFLNQVALEANVTNEGGVEGTFRLLKNVMGLWILQQCRQSWGGGDSYQYLIDLAAEASSAHAIFNVDDPAFLPPGDHPSLIRSMCEGTGQPIPTTKGQVVRCVLESLAARYRVVLDRLTWLTGKSVEAIHIVGGGGQNRLLNEMTANATGITVAAGPTEATIYGNALVQLIALSEIRDIAEGREMLAATIQPEIYIPQIDL